jgi:hypothetical protein
VGGDNPSGGGSGNAEIEKKSCSDFEDEDKK